MDYITGIHTSEGVKKYDYESLGNLPEDTGWVNCESLEVVAHNGIEENLPQVRRIGPHVYLRGIVSPKTNGLTDINPAFIIPEGFRPTGPIISLVAHGSTSNKFCLEINSSGNVRIYRYTNSEAMSAEMPSNAWLNCFATWLVD